MDCCVCLHPIAANEDSDKLDDGREVHVRCMDTSPDPNTAENQLGRAIYELAEEACTRGKGGQLSALNVLGVLDMVKHRLREQLLVDSRPNLMETFAKMFGPSPSN